MKFRTLFCWFCYLLFILSPLPPESASKSFTITQEISLENEQKQMTGLNADLMQLTKSLKRLHLVICVLAGIAIVEGLIIFLIVKDFDTEDY